MADEVNTEGSKATFSERVKQVIRPEALRPELFDSAYLELIKKTDFSVLIRIAILRTFPNQDPTSPTKNNYHLPERALLECFAAQKVEEEKKEEKQESYSSILTLYQKRAGEYLEPLNYLSNVRVRKNNGDRGIEETKITANFFTHPATSFFGFHRTTVSRAVLDFIGWPDPKSKHYTAGLAWFWSSWTILLPLRLLITVFKIIEKIFTILKNVAKIFTELLPYFIQMASVKLFTKTDNPVFKLLLGVSFYFSKYFRLILRPITSPFMSFREARDSNMGRPAWMRVVLTLFSSIISIGGITALSVLAGIYLWPLMLKATGSAVIHIPGTKLHFHFGHILDKYDGKVGHLTDKITDKVIRPLLDFINKTTLNDAQATGADLGMVFIFANFILRALFSGFCHGKKQHEIHKSPSSSSFDEEKKSPSNSMVDFSQLDDADKWNDWMLEGNGKLGKLKEWENEKNAELEGLKGESGRHVTNAKENIKKGEFPNFFNRRPKLADLVKVPQYYLGN